LHIIYVVDADLSSSLGVAKKIASQIELWRNYGNTVECFCISENCYSANIKRVEFSRLKARFIPMVLKRYLNRVLAYKKIQDYIENTKPDLLYVRQSIWVPQFGRMLLKVPSVIELNTNDLLEKRTLGFLSWLYCKLTRELLIRASSAFVAVSNEIAEPYVKYGKPIITVSNGFKVLATENNPIDKRKRVQFIFVGSPSQSWQGTDKVLRLALMFPEFDFHVVGEVLDGVLENVFYHGFKTGYALSDLYSKMNIGIGTLALHRKGMKEASPLKVREYLAYGLPVILGYKDTDVDGKDFVLNIGNYELNVNENKQQITDFVNEWSDRRVDQEQVIQLIDWEMKEQRRLKFFESIIKSAL